MGIWDWVTSAADTAWDYVPDIPYGVDEAVSGLGNLLSPGTSAAATPSTTPSTLPSTAPSSGSDWKNTLLSTAIQSAAGLGGQIFTQKAQEEAAKDAAKKELDILALKAKYGLLGGGGGGGGGGGASQLGAAYQNYINNYLNATNGVGNSLTNLATLTQNAALRSGK